MALFDKDMEKLGEEINQLIDLYVQEKKEKMRFENELKQAVANMSHDLRTPLTSILGYIQLAESDTITADESKQYLAIANKRAKRLETLLNGFFELSVIESTDYQLKSERININNLVLDVLMSFYDRFNEKNMEPIINIPEDNIFIISDGSAVTRVIENLISNALTHSSGNISITLEQQESTAILTVKNNALNLTEKDVELFFDRFYMVDQNRSGKSTGLGLSIVKSLMLKMGGNITATLEKGQLSIVCRWKNKGI
ncbi:sensor histidine kinase [Oceanobacillus rekensis]|uniref:sensor histidine kinase n=1 Tax=Oceanobacillus rekensis TaxID=937927 RepID=UPI001FEB7D11|nr:HAMP domain-containing sensor histidine kinase [Oceanobacillus rekensis]